MIVDFKDLLHNYYRENQFDIPMVADAIENGEVEIERVVETMRITNAAVSVAIDAGLDPMIFRVVNLREFIQHGMLFFTGSDEEWDYELVGTISDMAYEGSYHEGWIRPIGRVEPHPRFDVMRKKPNDDHWQIVCEGEWIDNGPPVGYLEELNEKFYGTKSTIELYGEQ